MTGPKYDTSSIPGYRGEGIYVRMVDTQTMVDGPFDSADAAVMHVWDNALDRNAYAVTEVRDYTAHEYTFLPAKEG